MRTDACRARGQVRPQLEARMMPESSNSETKTMNMIEAINSAMDVMLARDPNTVVMGEDVGFFGGVFRATAGLQKKHGKIGRAHVGTPVTNAQLVCRLLLAKKKTN